MTYRDLQHRLEELSDEQLDMNVSTVAFLAGGEVELLNVIDTVTAINYSELVSDFDCDSDLPLLVTSKTEA